MAEEKAKKIEWTLTRIISTIVLFSLGGTCLFLGIKPFIDGFYEAKDFANIGFIVLIVAFMVAFFKIHKPSRLIFWMGCFLLIIYTNIMFIFYEDLFF